MKITQRVWQLAEPLAQQRYCSIWDVEYVREGADWYLRVYLDKDGGVDIADCEAVSRALDPILDEEDLIADSYIFEVCSAGLERALKRPSDFEQFLGANVVVKLYRSVDGSKEFCGVLRAYDGGDVTISIGTQEKTFKKSEIALVQLRADF